MKRAGELLRYYCDTKRHLVCKPYSIANLHLMAKNLGINKCWFHKNHYDIPKKRIEQIMKRCKVVDSREIVDIIKYDAIQEVKIKIGKGGFNKFHLAQYQYSGSWNEENQI